MRITVIGAGAIGSAMVHDLLEHDEVAEVQVCDAHGRSLQNLRAQTTSDRLRPFQADARDPNVLRPILDGSDCVIGCVDPGLNAQLAQLCLDLGSHFCDLGGNDEVVQEQLALDAEARARGLWIVPNCGLAPGLINILCLHGLSQFDEAKAAHLRVGGVPYPPQEPFRFQISWSAQKILDDYTLPIRKIENGEVVPCQPFSGLEAIAFPEPFGEMEAFCTAGALSTLADELAGQVETLDHKTIRWPGHADQMSFLIGLGLADKRHIDVRTHLTYRDILVRKLRQHLGADQADAVLMRIVLHGIQAGQPRTLRYDMIAYYHEAGQMTAMRRCASVATGTIAVMLARGDVAGGGAAPPEHVMPHEAYYRHVVARGLPIEHAWHDGHLAVTE